MDSNNRAWALVNNTRFFALCLSRCCFVWHVYVAVPVHVHVKRKLERNVPVQWLLSCRYFSLAKRYNIIIITVRICETMRERERARLTITGWRENETRAFYSPLYTNTENILTLLVFKKHFELKQKKNHTQTNGTLYAQLRICQR